MLGRVNSRTRVRAGSCSPPGHWVMANGATEMDLWITLGARYRLGHWTEGGYPRSIEYMPC